MMTCPKCSTPLNFQSVHGTQIICPNCHQMIANDSPLQIGTEGRIKNENFKVVGCKKKQSSHLAWIEWLIVFDSSDIAWIRESQGNWALCEFLNSNSEIHNLDLNSIAGGQNISLRPDNYLIREAYSAQLEFQNGESLLKSRENIKSKVFIAPHLKAQKQFLQIEVIANDFPVVSRGEIFEFGQFHFKNLRSVDSGSRIQKINCPNCSGHFLIRYRSFSLRAVCNTCHSIIDISSDDHMSLRQFEITNRFQPSIAIGSHGKILGDSFEVIGSIKLVDPDHKSRHVIRYLLFSPTKSYRWLTDERGHWTISRTVLDLHFELGVQINYRGQKYFEDHSEQLQLQFAYGEFYWPIQKNELFGLDHFVSSPYEISVERRADLTEVYLGRYLTAAQVSQAFKLVKTLPKPEGSVPHEVSPYHHMMREFLIIQFVFILVCFFVHLRNMKVEGVVVHHSHIEMFENRGDEIQSTEPFEVRGSPSAMSILIWPPPLERLNISLTEIRGKVKYRFQTYGKQSKALISSVPDGVYLLSFVEQKNLARSTFDVKATFGAKSWSNLIIAAIFISIPSIFIFSVNQIFEIKRRRQRRLRRSQK